MPATIEHAAQQLLPVAFDVLQNLPDDLAAPGRDLGPALVGGAALALTMGLFAGDEALARRRPVRKTPYLEVLPATDGETSQVVTFYRSGFNSHPSAPGKAYSGAAREYGDMVIVHDPETGFDTAKTNTAIAEYCDQHKPAMVLLLGDSLGGLKHVPLAVFLTHELGMDTGLAQVCSPLKGDHVQGNHRRRMIKVLQVADILGIQGGPGLRYVLEGIGHKIDNPHKDLKETIAHCRRKFSRPNIPTNPQVRRDAGFLGRYASAPDLSRLRPEQLLHVSPDDVRRDQVVDNDAAHAYAEAHVGGSVTRIRNHRLKHANPCEIPEEAGNIVRGAFARLDVPSIAHRRASISMTPS